MTSKDRMPDDVLLHDLRRVLDVVDAHQSRNDEAAKTAFAWAHIDAELAEVVFDSAVDQPELVVRSGDSDPRQLTFKATAADVTIEIEIGRAGLIGQIIPPQPAHIGITQASGTDVDLETDEFGVFQVADLAPGQTSFVVRAADDSWSVRCAWNVT